MFKKWPFLILSFFIIKDCLDQLPYSYKSTLFCSVQAHGMLNGVILTGVYGVLMNGCVWYAMFYSYNGHARKVLPYTSHKVLNLCH